jgi:hypothetical protein
MTKPRAYKKRWYNDHTVLERIIQAWKLYLQRTPGPEAADLIGVSPAQYWIDIAHARELLRGIVVEVTANAVVEALASRHLISRELWARLDGLEKSRPFMRRPSLGKDEHGQAIPGEVVENALDPKWAEAEREILEALMKNEAAVEDLLQLHRVPTRVGSDDDGKPATPMVIVVDASGVAHKLLLRPDTLRRLTPPTVEESQA